MKKEICPNCSTRNLHKDYPQNADMDLCDNCGARYYKDNQGVQHRLPAFA